MSPSTATTCPPSPAHTARTHSTIFFASNFLPRWCLTCPLVCQGTPCYNSTTCLLRHPILSFLSILNVILFGAIYHRLLVKPHPASPQSMPPDDFSTQRTKYQNHLTPMGWGVRFKSVQHNQNTGHLFYYCSRRPHCSAARCYLRQTDLLHWFIILCSIGSPFFLFCQFVVTWLYSITIS